jgi:predicted nuclease of predicted toxin-antitoxin system
MKLLANENVPRLVVETLGVAGEDVVWIRTESPGITDQQVLVRALAEDRLLITFGKDFGELAVHHGLSASCGVVLF